MPRSPPRRSVAGPWWSPVVPKALWLPTPESLKSPEPQSAADVGGRQERPMSSVVKKRRRKMRKHKHKKYGKRMKKK